MSEEITQEEIEKIWEKVKGLDLWVSKRVLCRMFGVLEAHDKEGFYFKKLEFVIDNLE